MKGHPHAQLAQQYWKEAETDAEAWRNWEIQHFNGEWITCKNKPLFEIVSSYRRKPRTININGIEVPEPLRETPKYGEPCYIPRVAFHDHAVCIAYSGDHHSLSLLKDGMLHSTREAAELHAEALLSFTRKQP